MAKKRTESREQETRPADTMKEGPGKITPTWSVENVVATASVELTGERIDLNQVARKYPNCEYNPERFPGLVMRIDEPRATILIFTTGKMVITGLRHASEAQAVTKKVLDRLHDAKSKITGEPEIIIQNIVASGDLHKPVDLNQASIIMENAMYEPEVFPGLIYRMADPRTVFLIFSTGKVVCTGAKDKGTVAEAMDVLAARIEEYGIVQDKSEFAIGDDFFF